MVERAKLQVVASASAQPVPGDDCLMLLATAGDRTAFATLVTRHQDAVRRVCTVLLGDAGAARDVAQEVFLRLWHMRERYRPDGKLRPLLFTIARNLCSKSRRRQRLATFLGLSEGDAGPEQLTCAAPGPMERLLRGETVALLQGALQRLPERFRTPLLLRFGEGLDYEDIATVIGRTPSTARSRVHYGLKRLAKLLPAEVLP